VSDAADFQVRAVGPENGKVVVYLAGDLDLAVRDRLVAALTEASATTHRLVIDLSRITFIDSTGMKALVDVWRRRADAKRDLVLREPAPVVMRTLVMAGVADLLPIDLTGGRNR
jgi:anti-sigma B factor antagonist